MPAAALPPIATASAAAIGSATSNALLFPLDLITSRLQTQARGGRGRYKTPLQAARTIIKQEGWIGLYAGLESDTLSTLASNFAYFYLYSALQALVAKRKSVSASVSSSSKSAPKLFSATEELLIGFTAGVMSRAITNPLSVVTVRKQTLAKKPSVPETPDEERTPPRFRRRTTSDAADEEFGGGSSSLEIAKELYEEDGLKAFWAGFSTTALLSWNPAITMYLLKLFQRVLLPVAHQSKPSSAEVFATSAMASSLAITICYPLVLAKQRVQSGRFRYDNIVAALSSIVRRNGWQGLFAGWQSQILKSTLQLGLSMTLKARVERLIVLLWRRAQIKALVR